MGLIQDSIIHSENLEIIEKLNKILELDYEFMSKITNNRYFINNNLADSDLIICVDNNGNCSAGFLGILNGLISSPMLQNHKIAAVYDDNGKLIKFELLIK